VDRCAHCGLRMVTRDTEGDRRCLACARPETPRAIAVEESAAWPVCAVCRQPFPPRPKQRNRVCSLHCRAVGAALVSNATQRQERNWGR
jgi:hypothetical protein